MKVITKDTHFLSSKSALMSWLLHLTFVLEIKTKDTEQIESKSIIVARYYKLILTTSLFFISFILTMLPGGEQKQAQSAFVVSAQQTSDLNKKFKGRLLVGKQAKSSVISMLPTVRYW
jgi:hypothetical protein